MFALLGVFAASISRKSSQREQRLMKGKLSGRTKVTLALCLLAMGVIGLIAGIAFRKGLLNRDRLSLSIYGGLVIFVIYGGIMNPASVLMYQANPTWEMILTAYVTGVPADAIHASATVLFLWFLSEPMLEKLDRVKVKYGLIETGGAK